ncbi:MAG: TrmH family RNA methyltransferase [Bacillota bacterium]|jgi:TrmH family RNA methyltransferase
MERILEGKRIKMPIASKKTIKEIRSLRQKKFREEKQAYFAEGITIVMSALEHNAPVQSIVYSPELLKSEAAYRVLSQVQGRIPCYEATAESFQGISGRDNPVGVGAVVAYHDSTVESLQPSASEIYVALDGVKSPGNLGTVIRTADCLGFAGVFICGESTDQYHPECVRASMGALYTVPIVRFGSSGALLQWCVEHQIPVLTTSSRARDDITQIPGYPRPLVAVMGSEGTGLSGQVLEAGNLQVRIPMYGSVTSFNLAVATGILMYDIASKPPV